MADEIANVKLEDLGCDDYFDSQWKILQLTNTSIARVIAEYKEAYKIKNPDGEYLAVFLGNDHVDHADGNTGPRNTSRLKY